jgi:hypothetical protein
LFVRHEAVGLTRSELEEDAHLSAMILLSSEVGLSAVVGVDPGSSISVDPSSIVVGIADDEAGIVGSLFGGKANLFMTSLDLDSLQVFA